MVFCLVSTSKETTSFYLSSTSMQVCGLPFGSASAEGFTFSPVLRWTDSRWKFAAWALGLPCYYSACYPLGVDAPRRPRLQTVSFAESIHCSPTFILTAIILYPSVKRNTLPRLFLSIISTTQLDKRRNFLVRESGLSCHCSWNPRSMSDQLVLRFYLD